MTDASNEGASSTPATESQPLDSDVIFAEESNDAEQAENGDETGASDKPESKDENAEESETSKQSEEEKGFEKGEKRIKQLTAKVRTLERRLTDTSQRTQQQAKQLVEPQPPKLDNYDDIEKFNADLDKYKDELKTYAVEKTKYDAEQKAATEKQQTQAQEAIKTWNKRAQETLKRDPDFNTVAYFDAIQPSQAMDAFMQDSELGPDLMSHLHAEPDEADRIRELPPIKAIREMIALESQISNRIKGIKPKEAAPKSKPPGYVTGGNSSGPSKSRNAEDILYG